MNEHHGFKAYIGSSEVKIIPCIDHTIKKNACLCDRFEYFQTLNQGLLKSMFLTFNSTATLTVNISLFTITF